MIARPIPLVLLAALTLLPACGKSEPAANAAADTSIPLQGRAVSRPNQIQGAWLAINHGDLDSIELLKGDQAMVTGATGFNRGTTTLSYTLLDDGRLNLVSPQGQTTSYAATLAGDILELDNHNSGATPQRFQRIPEGQTPAQAREAHRAKMNQEMQQRILNLQAALKQGNAVIVKDADAATGWIMSLEFEDLDNTLDGRLILLENPDRVDPLSPVRVLPMRGQTAPADQFSSRLNLVFNAEPATEPSGQSDVQGVIRLTIKGPVDKPSIAGTAQFGKLWPSPVPVVLKADAKSHAAPLTKLEEQRARIAAELGRMKSFLGGRTVFTGQRTTLGGGPTEPVRLTVERNEQDTGYNAVVTVGNRTDQPAQAGVDLVLGTAALYVIMPWGEQWRLQTADTPDAMDGLWRPNNRTDFISHGNLALTLERSWATEQVAAEREAVRKYLAEDLRSPQRFTGFVERRFGATNISRWPVSVEIQTDGAGSVTGSAWLIAQKGGVALAGPIHNGSMNLTSTSVFDDSIDFSSYTNQRWQLGFAGLDPVPTFAGDLAGTRLGGGRVVLTAATPETFAAQRDQLIQALQGVTYASRTTDTATVRPDGHYYTFTVDAATGEVTAEITGNESKWALIPPALFTGSIVNDRGMPVLRGTVTPAPEPARGGGQDGDPFEITLAAVEDNGVIHLTGSTAPIERRNQDWFILTPTDEPVAMDDARQIRLAALKLGATAEIPTDPTPGD